VEALINTITDTLLLRKTKTLLETPGGVLFMKIVYTLADIVGKTEAAKTSAHTS